MNCWLRHNYIIRQLLPYPVDAALSTSSGWAFNKAAYLSIGDELLNGATRDINSFEIAKLCYQHGLPLVRMMTCSDSIEDIIHALQQLCLFVQDGGIIFTSGGTGVTHDDKTYEAIAIMMKQPLEIHESTFVAMQRFFERKGQKVGGKERMCMFPRGSHTIESPFWLPIVVNQYQSAYIFSFPGVPQLFQKMAAALFDSPGYWRQPPKHVELFTEKFESDFADGLRAIQQRHAMVKIGSYPVNFSVGCGADNVSLPCYRVKISIDGHDSTAVEQARLEIKQLV